MALFNKLFQSKKVIKQQICHDNTFNDDVIPFAFDKTQVRVLLFRECERRGRKLLYDSSEKKTSEEINDKANLCSKKLNDQNEEKEQTIGVQCKLTSSDTLLLGEMVFGSVAMSHQGMSLKIHVLKSPQRLMYTKVYSNPLRQQYPSNETCTSSHSSISSQYDGEISSSVRLSSAWPGLETNSQIPPILIKDDHLAVNCFIGKSDSGYSSQPSSHSSIGYQGSSYELWSRNDECFPSTLLSVENSICNKNLSSSSSIQWRLTQHYSSTLDNVQTILHNIPAKRKDSEISRSSISSSLSDNFDGSGRCTQKIKMGIAVVITLTEKSSSKMLSFLMDHAVLMEGALTRLKQAVHQALCKPQLFLNIMSTATHETAQWLVDLLSSPRIRLPAWNHILSCNKSLTKGKIADVFMNDLCSLLCTMDTKDTYFFMSTLLTNILTFHLGWVNSVSPYNTSKQKELDSINHYAPYNPLWAQLGEMYGVIGVPSRVSRTIVYGKQNIYLIRKILAVLTYFIRCVNVKRYELEQTPVTWEAVDNLINCYKSDLEPDNFVELSAKNDKVQISTCDIEMRTFSTNQNISFDNNKLNFKESCVVEPNSTLIKLNEQHCESDSTLCPSHSINLTNSNDTLSSKSSKNSIINVSVSEYKNGLNRLQNKTKLTSTDFKTLSRAPTVGCMGVLCTLADNDNESNDSLSEIVYNNFTPNPNENESTTSRKVENNVVFILGENEELVGLKETTNNSTTIPETKQNADSFKEQINERGNSETKECITPEQDTSSSHNTSNWDETQTKTCCIHTSQCQHSTFKKHSGVKFDFEKYPQIVTNYMKSKNLQLLDRHVIGKPGNLKFVESDELGAESSLIDLPKECDACQNCSFSGQSLQTPSNASELEYTSDIPDHEFQYAKECVVAPKDIKSEETKVFVKKKLNNTVIVNKNDSNEIVDSDNSVNGNTEIVNLQHSEKSVTELPLNSTSLNYDEQESFVNGYCNSLLGSVSDHYISDLVLQGGVGGTKSDWEKSLFRDLKLQPGATCLFADIDDWSVQVFGSGGGGAGDMSALVASMLDCIPQMCHAKVPSLQCLAFIESKLREMCIRSKGLAQLLIDKDFCDMEYLTKTLNLEPNDVPLLLAIASTHTPQTTLKYGVSYR